MESHDADTSSSSSSRFLKTVSLFSEQNPFVYFLSPLALIDFLFSIVVYCPFECRENGGKEKKTWNIVCLYDWWLIKSKEDCKGKRLAVAGLTSREQQAVRVFSSAPIIKRYDVFTLETVDGICVVLKSIINKSRTNENGFSDEVFSHFVLGFPPHWEEYAEEKYLGGESVGDASKRNSGFDELTTDSGSMKNSSPTIMPPFMQEETPNKHKRAITEENHDNMEDILDETNVRLEDNENIFLAKNRSNIQYNSCNESSIDVLRECISQNVSKKIIEDASKVSNLQNHGADLSVDIGSGVSTSQDKGHLGFTPSPVNINADSMKKDASENCPLSIGSDVNTVHSLEVNITVPEEPSRHHVTRFSRRMDNSKSNRKGKKGTMGKSKGYDVDNANPSNVDQTVSAESSEKLKRSSSTQMKIAVEERERDNDAKGSTSGKKAKRKLKYDTHVTPLTREGKKKAFIFSPEAKSFKRSRSGRLLVPTLDFWRNQMAVYDADRQITGIMDPPVGEPSRDCFKP